MYQIKQLTEQWKSLQPLKPENQKRLDNKFRLEFNYNSNHLEGNTLTYSEAKLMLLFDQTRGNHELREYEELKAHDVALRMINEEALDHERPLTENFIRLLNETILVRPFWKDATTPDGQPTRRLINVGEYKEHPNSVILPNGDIFEYASPQETPAMMADLVQWYNSEAESGELSPIELAALLHYKYIRIHPFDDGNGRVARLLVNYVLFRNGLPPVIIKSTDKKNYLRALQGADAGFINDFTDYMSEQLVWSLDIAIRAAKGESIDEPDDLDKKLHLLRQEWGENPDENIEIRHGKEAVRLVIKFGIFPLLRAWEKRLEQFDSFFLDRKVKVYYCNNRSSLYSQVEANTFNELMRKIEEINIHQKLEFSTTCQGLRKIDNNVSINGGMITVHFHSNAYEITYTNGAKPVSKLYHQSLDEDEIDTIVSTLGNYLFNEIDTLKNSKK